MITSRLPDLRKAELVEKKSKIHWGILELFHSLHIDQQTRRVLLLRKRRREETILDSLVILDDVLMFIIRGRVGRWQW
jgi:hypothetical protein